MKTTMMIPLGPLVALILTSACHGHEPPIAMPTDVAAIQGPSWIKRMGLKVDETKLGQVGGKVPPRGAIPNGSPIEIGKAATNERAARRLLAQPMTVTGADLYRLDCQACHGAEGLGAPPEINSLVDPVRATSIVLFRERMEKADHPVDEKMAATLASDAAATLRKRIRGGGKKMPAFPHLSDQEVETLVAYLGDLAGVPVAERPAARKVTASQAHLSEHLVEGTCHICHDATGPGPHQMMMTPGLIPSLASLPQQRSAAQVVAKVREGVQATGGGGMGRMMGG